MKSQILILIAAVAMMFGSVGCLPEQLSPEQLQQLATQQETLQDQVDSLQEQAEKLTDALAEGGIVGSETEAEVEKISNEINKVQEQISAIAKALEGVELTGDEQQDLIALFQAANAATTPFNPYAAPIGVGLTLLSTVLGWIAKRNSDKAKAAEVKYQAHKQAVEKTMKEVSASENKEVVAVETQLYTNIGDARAKLGVT